MEDIVYLEIIPVAKDSIGPHYFEYKYDAFAVNTETGGMYYYLDCNGNPDMENDAPLYISYTPEDWDAFMAALEDCSFTDWKDIGEYRYRASLRGWQVYIRYADGAAELLYGSREKSSDKDIQRFDQLWSYIQTFTATFPDRMEAAAATSSGTS